jgi:phospholipase C
MTIGTTRGNRSECGHDSVFHRPVHRRVLAALSASVAVLSLCCSFGYAGDGGRDDDARRMQTKTPIKHLVVIFQENRAFDHYFGTYPQAANIPGEQSWIGIPAPEFHALPGTPKANNYLTHPDVFLHNPNRSFTGAQANPQRLRPADAYSCPPLTNLYTPSQQAVDGGRMDQFVPFLGRAIEGCPADGTGIMDYFDGNTVSGLWNYAQHFAMSDAFFQTDYGPTLPGHINLISGNIHGAIVHGAPDPTDTFTSLVDGSLTLLNNARPFLDDCAPGSVEMSGRNVGDLLNEKHITWGWFNGGFAATTPAVLNPDGSTQTPAVCGQAHTLFEITIDGTTYVVPNPTINFTTDIHILRADYDVGIVPFMYYASTRNPHHLPPTSVAAIGTTDQANHQYDTSDFMNALDAGNLPAVTFLKPPVFAWEHPAISDPLTAQAWFIPIINKIMTSREWESTAIMITYDDAGTLYDHEPPPVLDRSNTSIDFHCGSGTPEPGDQFARCRLGLRLPFVVISPWARHNYIDHTVTEQASILRFIEDNWELGFIDGPKPLPPGTESYDRYAGSLMGAFDFDRQPDTRPLILDPIRGTVVDGEGRRPHDE